MKLKEVENQPARQREPEVQPPYAPDFGKPPPKKRGDDRVHKWKTTREKGGYEVWYYDDEPVSGITWVTRIGAERERHKLNDPTTKIVSIHYVSDKEKF